MTCVFNFIVDRTVRGRIYPALARWHAEPYTQSWREFQNHWPNTVPLRLQEYCDYHQATITLQSLNDLHGLVYYPIALAWFDFSLDYIALIPQPILQALKDKKIRILFYYHEGDNPERIKDRLDQLCRLNHLPTSCYVFVSSNSAADRLDQCVSFQDSELWYWQRNKSTTPLPIHDQPRSRQFTLLCRLHKWWRAAVIADLARLGALQNSYWSYCEAGNDNESLDQCPIAIDDIDGLRSTLMQFVGHAPYYADSLTQDQRNDHSINVDHYFTDAYCNIVLETMFDYDQSHGVLLSEKTFKPIKHGQLFFIAGAAGSLKVLRDLGYRTFDHVLDNSYDSEQDNTQRWLKLRSAIVLAQQQGLPQLFQAARADIEHNQQLFQATKHQRLNILLQKIHDKSR